MTNNFLNVDLEIESHEDLQPIVRSFGDRVCNLYYGQDSGHYLATFELSDIAVIDADAIVYNFCLLIESFDRSAKSLWDRALTKVFDLGYGSASESSSYSSALSAETISKVAALGASIRVTIYASSPD
jgi:hypothetical protein